MYVCVVFLRSKISYDSGNGSNTAGMLDKLLIYYLVCRYLFLLVFGIGHNFQDQSSVHLNDR